jgi:hypothetical protein
VAEGLVEPVLLEHFGRPAAEGAEWSAILAEHPRHNAKKTRPKRQPRPPIQPMPRRQGFPSFEELSQAATKAGGYAKLSRDVIITVSAGRTTSTFKLPRLPREILMAQRAIPTEIARCLQ